MLDCSQIQVFFLNTNVNCYLALVALTIIDQLVNGRTFYCHQCCHLQTFTTLSLFCSCWDRLSVMICRLQYNTEQCAAGTQKTVCTTCATLSGWFGVMRLCLGAAKISVSKRIQSSLKCNFLKDYILRNFIPPLPQVDKCHLF